MRFNKCHVIDYPSGRWGFVGRVPAELAFVRRDGAPMSAMDYKHAAECNTPALLGHITRAFASRDEAIAAALAAGIEVS